MRLEEAYSGWGERRLTQAQAAQLLGVCTRTFRRTIHRYEDEGLDGLLDKRMSQISHRPPPRSEPAPGLIGGAPAQGVGGREDHRHGRSQPVYRRRLSAGLQQGVYAAGKRRRIGVRRASGSEPTR